MNRSNISRKEQEQLERIVDAIDWRVFVAVKEHFDRAGRLDDFAAAVTSEDRMEQRKAIAGCFKASTTAALKNADIFFSVARRVENDATLSGLLPADKFDANDLALLEKHGFKSLASLIRARL